jgi:hypothetical protein
MRAELNISKEIEQPETKDNPGGTFQENFYQVFEWNGIDHITLRFKGLADGYPVVTIEEQGNPNTPKGIIIFERRIS